MAILVRIKLPNRSEYRKVIRTKKDNFVLLGDNYNIDFNAAYLTTIWGGFVKVQCLDYEKGKEDPVYYFNKPDENIPRTKHKAHHVAEVIRRLIEDQRIAIIMLIVTIVAAGCAGIAAYLAYDAGSKASECLDLMRRLYNNTGF
ncbi:MAG: hypothetical protein H7836_11410 [Magnetococcus sp. YQC-3]